VITANKEQKRNSNGLFLIILPKTRKSSFNLLCFFVLRTGLVNTVEEEGIPK